MKRRFRITCSLAASAVAACAALAADPAPTVPAASTDRLAASIERLAGLIEQEAKLRAGDREMRKVEVAVAVMGLRYRKIERIETEIRSLEESEQSSREELASLRSRMEMIQKVQPGEGVPPPEQLKLVVAEGEREIAAMETRIKNSGEKKSSLQNDLETERRGVAGLEQTVESWLEGLR